MTTMLEKMARAMVTEQGDDYDALPEMGRRNAKNECRAALLAIREPDDEVLKAGVAGADAISYKCDDDDPWFQLEMRAGTYAPECCGAFTAMIDAILNEKPEGS